MEVITQTNKVMLFESINPQVYNILTLIGDVKGKDSLSDDEVKEIFRRLEVESFDDFIKKFMPTIYSFYNANNQKIMYTLEKPEHVPENMLTEIPLNNQNDFFRMLTTLMDTKRSQGLMNVDFKFETLLELISPAKVVDDIKQTRAELQYTFGEYAALEDGDPKKLDVADKLNVIVESASDNYSNVLAMLPLAIEDIKARLLLGGGDDKDDTPLALGRLSMGEDGELKVIEAPKEEKTELALVDDHVNEGLIEVLEEDYENVCDDESPYIKSLVVRTFCPLPSTTVQEVDLELEVKNYNSYLEFYKTAKEDFIKIVKPLAQKLLGVKTFFDQYPAAKLKGGMKPKMLVTNCTPEMMAKSNNIPRLIAFLNSVNGKNDYTNTIWYSIMTSLSMDPREKVKLKRERFKGNDVIENPHVNSMESLTRLIDVCKDYRIQCFFSFEESEFTTFNMLAIEGVDKYIDRCAPMIGKAYSEFAIPVYPNFTVVPKDKSGVLLDKKMIISESGKPQLSKEAEDMMRLWVEGVYIGGAYAAAGIVAAYQCPLYLKKIFKRNVHRDLPGVRFDIEQGDNALLVKTTLAKEITGFTNATKDHINRRSFGFVFSSENAAYDGMAISNIMVYKARCLMDVEGVYEPIYKTQVTTYIERVMRHATGDFKADNIREFFSNKPTSQKSLWMGKREMVNGILHMGDDIDYTIDDQSGLCTLDETFNGDSKNLEIEIKRHVAVASASK